MIQQVSVPVAGAGTLAVIISSPALASYDVAADGSSPNHPHVIPEVIGHKNTVFTPREDLGVLGS